VYPSLISRCFHQPRRDKHIRPADQYHPRASQVGFESDDIMMCSQQVYCSSKECRKGSCHKSLARMRLDLELSLESIIATFSELTVLDFARRGYFCSWSNIFQSLEHREHVFDFWIRLTHYFQWTASPLNRPFSGSQKYSTSTPPHV
jgi:hypothetical protein